jgi:kynurenine formamidase
MLTWTIQVGRLNLLTPSHVKSVLSNEQQHGIVSSLNWKMTLPREPGFSRQACERRLEPFKGILVNDEIVHMNTQSGSQLDGFRHIAHQPSKLFYNNLKQEEIADGTSTRCGIQAASRRGIVGRGVLLDFVRWAEANNLEYDPFDSYAITLDQILQVAAWEGVEFRCGDILLVRTGWVQKYNASLANSLQDDLKRVAAKHPSAIGLESSEEMRRWLHDQYFAVVGGDQPAFEVWPPVQTPILHEFLLACWGIMIGEMLDLEDLSAKCNEMGKYSFVFMSAPLNLPGGVASLANALCIL